jgi:hypothetical protein
MKSHKTPSLSSKVYLNPLPSIQHDETKTSQQVPSRLSKLQKAPCKSASHTLFNLPLQKTNIHKLSATNKVLLAQTV